MTNVHIPTPAQRKTHLSQVQPQVSSEAQALDLLLQRCVQALLSPVANQNSPVTVSIFDEPEAVVADAISILSEFQWLARETDNGKNEGFTHLELTPAQYSV